MTTIISAEILTNTGVDREVLPDGSVIWVARDLSLDGCIAQATSREEALAALEAAREDYRAVVRQLRASTPGFVTVVESTGESRFPINTIKTSVLG
jgi:predicted RNase H-like HicB family nuclease